MSRLQMIRTFYRWVNHCLLLQCLIQWIVLVKIDVGSLFSSESVLSQRIVWLWPRVAFGLFRESVFDSTNRFGQNREYVLAWFIISHSTLPPGVHIKILHRKGKDNAIRILLYIEALIYWSSIRLDKSNMTPSVQNNGHCNSGRKCQ